MSEGVAVPVAPKSATRARRHVHEVDVVRVLTFASVIAVHVVGHTNGSYSVSSNGLLMLLHFTREAFFVLTGFVLIHQYYDRPFRLQHFWARRFLTVGVPYVAWSAIYTGLRWVEGRRTMSMEHLLHLFGTYLINGTAWYHLYFLLVSMQIYLIYPLIAALLRVTRGYHLVLLAVSAVLEIALMTAQQYDRPTTGTLGAVFRHTKLLVTSYQFYVLLGAVVAAHLDEVVAWLRRFSAVVVLGFLGTGGAALAWYLVEVSRGHRPSLASAVLQPIMVPWALGAVAGLFLLGIVWSDHRTPGSRLDAFFRLGSDRSFGIFLVHPAVLYFLMKYDHNWLPHDLPRFWLTLIRYVLTIAGSIVAIEIVRRTPLSLALTGRSYRRKPPSAGTGASVPREEPLHARNVARTASARGEAPRDGSDDGDRQRPADAAVRGHGGELQRTD